MTRNMSRNADLRQLLTTRRRVMQDTVDRRVLEGRSDLPTDGRDGLEHSEADSQMDLAFALLQMRAETIASIEAAVARIDAGVYGSCVDCDSRIPDRRLRALPFAPRCQACEEAREAGQARTPTRRRDQLSVHADAVVNL